MKIAFQLHRNWTQPPFVGSFCLTFFSGNAARDYTIVKTELWSHLRIGCFPVSIDVICKLAALIPGKGCGRLQDKSPIDLDKNGSRGHADGEHGHPLHSLPWQEESPTGKIRTQGEGRSSGWVTNQECGFHVVTIPVVQIATEPNVLSASPTAPGQPMSISHMGPLCWWLRFKS